MKLNDRDLDTLVLAAVDLILKWNTCLMPHNLGPIGLEGDLVVWWFIIINPACVMNLTVCKPNLNGMDYGLWCSQTGLPFSR